MKQATRVIEILAALFVAFSVFGALFWPSHQRFILDDLLLPFGLTNLALIFVKNKEWRIILLTFAALAFCGLLSDVLANDSIRTGPIGFYVRWMKWAVILATITNTTIINRKSLEKTVIGVFLTFTLLNLLMLTNPLGVGQWVQSLYALEPDMVIYNLNEYGSFRLSGTMRNPNNNAAIFALFFLYFLHTNSKRMWRYILLALMFIFIAQSRTVLIIALALLGLYIILKNSAKQKVILFGAVGMGIVAFMTLVKSNNLISLINGTAFQSNSWMSRMDHFSVLSSSDRFFGNGIVLNPIEQLGFYMDSEYLALILQYGWVGMTLWVVVLLSLVNLEKKLCGRLLFSGSIMLFVLTLSTTNVVFLNLELAPVLCFLFGAWLFSQRLDKVNRSSEKETK